MPGTFLTDLERKRLDEFPQEISMEDIITFFTLSEEDIVMVRKRRQAHNQLGFAIQLCTLRYLDFCPNDLNSIPFKVIKIVADQIGVSEKGLSEYGKRKHTQTDHLKEIQVYLGIRNATESDLEEIDKWLLERTMEHDKPIVLYQMVCEKLCRDKIMRPGVTTLERMVIKARQNSQKEIYNRLNFLITKEFKTYFDEILIPDEKSGITPLSWLRYGSISNSSKSILKTIKKVTFLKKAGIHNWKINCINPNKIKFLAQLGRKSSNQMLQRANPHRRYPILIAFLHQSLEDITDELIEMYDNCLSNYNSKAKKELEDFQLSVAKKTNESLKIFQDIGKIILNPEISNQKLRETIFRKVPEKELYKAVEKCDEIIRFDDKFYDFFAKRYSCIREFAPMFLDNLVFHSCNTDDPLIEAIELLRQLNATGKRKVPQTAPMEFIPDSWLPYMEDKGGNINRRYYELCVLWQLRNAFRSGDIWVENSRKYTNPESYLIPIEQWKFSKSEYCEIIEISETVEERITQTKVELEQLLLKVDKNFKKNPYARIDKGKLTITPIKAEDLPESVEDLKKVITEQLPRVELAELLIEVDKWTQFTDCFQHPGGYKPKNKEMIIYIYASIIAQACNFGLKRMAEITDLSHNQLIWCNNWYLREETIQNAINKLVDYQYHQPLSKYWGDGTLSSSDGQHIPVSVKTKNATALPKYFGYGKGLTFYTWTSDQFSQYGSKVVTSTIRDATYVLDAILDNETELQILEHTTDTAGYTELVFALFDLLGMQFSPRIKDLGDQKLYYFDKKNNYKSIKNILKVKINPKIIIDNWENILRTTVSIKFGWVTASLFISKLQAYPQQNILTKALQEYGRIIKTMFILNYIDSEGYRRRILIQLNKGEALHALRQFLFFANQGIIRKSQFELQSNQLNCLTLLTNAVMVWNTRYMEAVIQNLEQESYQINEDDLKHISPSRFEHINKYGRYNFNIEQEMARDTLRPLRKFKKP